MKIQTDQRLRERDVGTWSGKTREEIGAAYPDEYNLWIEGREVAPGGGETSSDILLRAHLFFDEVRLLHKGGGTVVVVSHGGWIKTASQWVLTGKLDRIGLGVVSQGSLTVFSLTRDVWRLEAYNDRGHLLDIEPVDQEAAAPPVY